MTSRERLLEVLRHGVPDRVPWSPLIDGYYLAGLPEPVTDLEAALEVGADAMVRKIPVYARSVFLPHEMPGKSGPCEIPTPDPPGGIERDSRFTGDLISRSYKTPLGVLTERWRITAASPYIPFPVEYLVKSADDIAPYRYLVEREEFVPYFDVFNRLDAQVGQAGIVTTVAPHTPVQHLLLIHMGVETFYYLLTDQRDRMVALMDLMHERNREVCQIIGESPAEVAIEYENTGTTYVSPRIYEEFEMPPMDVYADMLHAGGKVFLVHMCGRLRGLADLIGRGHQDGSIDLAPPPTGDWTLAEARRAWPGKILGGGLNSILLAEGTPEEVAKHAREVLASIGSDRDVILGNGDAILLGTPPENLRIVTKTVEEFGRYPLN